MAVRIAALGDNCIDRFLPPVNRLLAGGNAVNVAARSPISALSGRTAKECICAPNCSATGWALQGC
jgi:hypothetical protein